MTSATLAARLEKLRKLHADILMERRPVPGDIFAAASRVARRIPRLGSLLEKLRRAETLQAISA